MPIAPEYLHLVFPDVVFEALLYGRASRDPKKKGRSVADQIGNGRELCDTHSWPIAGVFDQDIDRSASRHARRKRADFEALIDAIEAGRGRIVVAWEASRYYRDIEAYIRLRNACMENNVLLCYNGQIFDLSKREDRKATAQDALQAEDEADGIRDRNLRTTRAQATKGAPHGRLLWGYARRYDPDTGDLIEQYPHPTRGPVVEEVFERVEAGETEYAILLDLRSRGDRVPDSRWEHWHVRAMLRNPGYIAQRIFQGKVIGDAAWPPLVKEQIFWAVQAILEDPARQVTRDTSVRHLLSFIALCGECPEAPPQKIQKARYLSYACSERYDTAIREAVLDAYVEEALIQWLASPKAADAFRDDRQKAQAATARKRVKALHQQLREARALAGQMDETGAPKLSVASLAALEASLTPQIHEATRASKVTVAPPSVQALLTATDVETCWHGMTLPQKREVVRAVVTVRLHKAHARGARTIRPGRVTLSFIGQPGFVPHQRGRRLTSRDGTPTQDGAGGPAAV